MTTPGFASRDTTSTFRQFPHRDERAMADIEGMNEPGWSNSQHTEDDAAVEAVETPDPAEATEPAAETPAKPARKSTAKKG